MTWTNPTTQARINLGNVLALALSHADEFMREAEAQHAKVKADPFFTEADQRASLTEVLLAHRVLALLRPAAEMCPATPDDTPVVVPTANRVVHPPAPGWSRAPEEVMGSTVGSLALALYSLAGCKHFDLHVDDDGHHHLICDGATNAQGAYMAMHSIFGITLPHLSAL